MDVNQGSVGISRGNLSGNMPGWVEEEEAGEGRGQGKRWFPPVGTLG